ncbi:MAG: hypothetical protein ACD_58C00037G0007 [uncultured bacterium]|nr:MAG: hypothetical protein ACD_58C00037G0007 [uncultured bacterium]
MNKTKKIIGFIGWLIFTLLIAGVAVYLILIANGYKINYQYLSFQKTGMIYLESNPADVQIYINDKFEGIGTPFKLSNLNTGKYFVKISKNGYNEWTKTLDVESGKTEAQEDIELFINNPAQLDVSEDEKISFNDLVNQWPAKGLEIKNQSEVWFNDVYITRFSGLIQQVGWYPNLKHILVQIDNKIIIMDPDGSNITKIVDLDSSNKCQFVIINSNRELLYLDGYNLKKVRIKE